MREVEIFSKIRDHIRGVEEEEKDVDFLRRGTRRKTQMNQKVKRNRLLNQMKKYICTKVHLRRSTIPYFGYPKDQPTVMLETEAEQTLRWNVDDLFSS